MKIAHPEQNMMVGTFIEVETAKLLKPDDSQACVEGVEFADLNIGPIQVGRAVRKLSQSLVPQLLAMFGRIVGRTQHTIQRASLPIKVKAYINEWDAFARSKSKISARDRPLSTHTNAKVTPFKSSEHDASMNFREADSPFRRFW